MHFKERKMEFFPSYIKKLLNLDHNWIAFWFLADKWRLPVHAHHSPENTLISAVRIWTEHEKRQLITRTIFVTRTVQVRQWSTISKKSTFFTDWWKEKQRKVKTFDRNEVFTDKQNLTFYKQKTYLDVMTSFQSESITKCSI